MRTIPAIVPSPGKCSRFNSGARYPGNTPSPSGILRILPRRCGEGQILPLQIVAKIARSFARIEFVAEILALHMDPALHRRR